MEKREQVKIIVQALKENNQLYSGTNEGSFSLALEAGLEAVEATIKKLRMEKAEIEAMEKFKSAFAGENYVSKKEKTEEDRRWELSYEYGYTQERINTIIDQEKKEGLWQEIN